MTRSLSCARSLLRALALSLLSFSLSLALSTFIFAIVSGSTCVSLRVCARVRVPIVGILHDKVRAGLGFRV
jgi:hypothetical protein